jgi:hypothetical protein
MSAGVVPYKVGPVGTPTLDELQALRALMQRVYPALAAVMAHLKARDQRDEFEQIWRALRDWYRKVEMQRGCKQSQREHSRRYGKDARLC